MSRERAGGVAIVALAMALAGCVTEGPPLKPPPKALPEQPSGIAPDRMLASASPVLMDTDRNGYVDTAKVTVYLFAHGYDLPVTSAGSFEFELRAADGATLRTWLIDENAARAAEKMFMPGPGYLFELSLIDSGAERGGKARDEVPMQRGELVSRFVPSASGKPPIESRSPLTVNLGPAPGGGGGGGGG